MSFLLGCDRGQKTKPKIILAKFYPSHSLGRIRFQRIASVSNQKREFAGNTYSYLSIHEKQNRIDGGGIDTNAARAS